MKGDGILWILGKYGLSVFGKRTDLGLEQEYYRMNINVRALLLDELRNYLTKNMMIDITSML
jgi:hypothetical protein